MANIKSAIKRAQLTKVKTLRNKGYKTNLKTTIKKFEQTFEAGNIDEAKAAYTLAQKRLDTATVKGILHKNAAARYKSKLAKKLNSVI